MTFHTQDLMLQIYQAAALQTEFPKSAGAEQQIEMLHAGEGRARPDHTKAGFEQRLVVCLSVVGDKDIEP